MTDRVALVTGAARGQGAAIVARLHADGFRVAACDVRVEELAASVDGLDGVVAAPLDVTSEDQWNAAVGRAVETFGLLTTLINNAGVLHRTPLAEETAEGFEGSWRFNCLGPFLGIRAALPHLRHIVVNDKRLSPGFWWPMSAEAEDIIGCIKFGKWPQPDAAERWIGNKVRGECNRD